jgi:hypothetical protein
MDDLRGSLDLAEKQTREEIDRLNEVLKHILLAKQFLNSETPIPDEEEEAPPPGTTELVPGVEHKPPSDLEVQYKTRYEKGSTSSCIVNVLHRLAEPSDSKTIHGELLSGGWETKSKDSLMAVRNALARLSKSQDIQTVKLEGILHYSAKPIKELV